MYELVMQEVVEPRVVGSWNLLPSIFNRAEIEAESFAKNPEAELQWYSWINWDFLTSTQSSVPEYAGIRTALLGTLWVMVIVILFAVPVGIGAAIYLEEYATHGRINRILQTNIDNLAGVPSIIYGILGLAIFVRTLEVITSGKMFGVADPTTANGRTILSAGLTLSLLVLPIIIINSQEAIRAVPQAFREAATAWAARVAGGVEPRAAQCVAGHPHRHDSGHFPGHRRNGAAGRDRRFDLYHGRSRRTIFQVHRAAHADLPVDNTAPAGIQAHCGGGQHRLVDSDVYAQRHCDLPAQPL